MNYDSSAEQRRTEKEKSRALVVGLGFSCSALGRGVDKLCVCVCTLRFAKALHIFLERMSCRHVSVGLVPDRTGAV